jgi:hypothetical protein
MSTVTLAAPLELAGLRQNLAGRLTAALSDTVDVAGRNLRTLLRTPQALVFATIQPMIFVLLFRYAFGGAIRVPGVNYVDYLMPGIFAQSVAFGAIGTAVGLSADLRSGILVRFRTLPMARVAVLGGRTLADLVRNLAVVAVMIGVGFAVGFRTASGAGLLAALALVIAFAYAASWAFRSRAAGQRPGSRSGGRRADRVPAGLHLLRVRPAALDARLAAGHRLAPAGQRPGHRGTGAGSRRARRR